MTKSIFSHEKKQLCLNGPVWAIEKYTLLSDPSHHVHTTPFCTLQNSLKVRSAVVAEHAVSIATVKFLSFYVPCTLYMSVFLLRKQVPF